MSQGLRYREQAVQLREEVTRAIAMDTSFPEGTAGLLKIPSLGQECPLAEDTGEETLKTHAGLIEGSDPPGTPGGNTAIAAHSARNGFLCSFCWFQNIDRLQEGEKVVLIYRDHTYTYSVYEVLTYVYPEDPEPFQRETGREILTLQTCTQGSPEYRTYVHAERIS